MKTLILFLSFISLSSFADIRQELAACHKEKNQLMIKLIKDYYKDPNWVKQNEQYLAVSKKIMEKSIAKMPSIGESSQPWNEIWANSSELKKDADIAKLFAEHQKISAERDLYISAKDDEYKAICDKLESLRKELKASYKKKQNI